MAILEQETLIVNEGPIAQIMLNRPQHLNALNVDIFSGLLLAFERLERNAELRVVTLWGAGDKAFAAGADIPGMAGLGARAIADYIELGQRALRSVEKARVPVVAAVNGYVLGGGLELALACDVIVAAHDARLGFPEASLGIIPGFGGAQRLMQRCGTGTARRLIYSGEMIEAPEALQLGIVDKLAEPEQLTQEVQALAEKIHSCAPLAVARAKQLIGSIVQSDLLSGLRQEAEAFLELFQSDDCAEGLEAFMQKREPQFKGR